MNHDEKRLWLIKYLIGENVHYRNTQIPDDISEQKDMLRALMNVRMPMPVTEEFLEIQDSYLKKENASMGGYISVDDMTPCKSDDRIYIWQGDITRLSVDAIVNAANSQMLGCFQPLHSCIDNIIHSKAGVQLRLKMNEIMEAQGHEESVGQAKITPAYNLPCKFVLHTVGPIVQGPLTQKHEKLLASCYSSCLDMAEKNSVKSIAFCCISTGVFMFPNKRAAEIATKTVKNWLDETGSDMKIVFNVFKDVDWNLYYNILNM